MRLCSLGSCACSLTNAGDTQAGPKLAGPYYTEEIVKGIMKALTEACRLRCVDLVTASAMLSIMDPRVPVMSAELQNVMCGYKYERCT